MFEIKNSLLLSFDDFYIAIFTSRIPAAIEDENYITGNYTTSFDIYIYII